MNQRTYAKIDLDAIKYNTDNVLKKIGKNTKLLAVIKADAYGHGAVEIGRVLESRCDFFGVACIEEALELVNANLKKPIIILGTVLPFDFENVVKYDIRIPIFTYEEAKALSDEAVKQNKTAKFHFCVDTGMSRIGFQVCEESADLCEKIITLPNIEAEGLFSHFATADEKDLSKAEEQKRKFKEFADMLSQRNIEAPIKHINNSAGIMVFDEFFNMVRMGIVTYGLYPSADVDKKLLDIKPALEWKTHISYVKTLEAGREISYGGTYKTEKSTVVATIPVGYADGYPRCLSNKGRVIVNGEYADIIGRVCMDQFMVDVSNIKGVQVGDEVTLVGRDGNAFLSMEEVSEAAHSFNYELPCRISRRVTRVYTENSKEVKSVNYIL